MQDIQRKKLTIIIIAYIIGMTILPIPILLILRTIFNISINSTNTTVLALINFIIYAVLTTFMTFFLRSFLLEEWKNIKHCKKFSKFIILGWLSVLISGAIGNLLLRLITGETGTSANQTAIANVLGNYPFLIILPIVIGAPIVEEIVFRFATMNLLKTNPAMKILISSLLFGFIHVMAAGDWIFIIPYLAMGIPLGYIYHKSKNIWTVIIIHAINNSIAASALLLSGILSN